MLLQIHDELVFEVPEAQIEPVTRLVIERMRDGSRRSAGGRRRPRSRLVRRQVGAMWICPTHAFCLNAFMVLICVVWLMRCPMNLSQGHSLPVRVCL